MGKTKRMDQVKEIIETYLSTGSIKATSRRLSLSKNTVRQYVRRAESHCSDLRMVLRLSEEKLSAIFYPIRSRKSERERIFESQLGYWLSEQNRVGVTKHILWEEYRKEYTEGYSYSQFCARLSQSSSQSDLTLALSHAPGEVMQVDFAGKKLRWVDKDTGKEHRAEVLVAVLAHSQYTFAIALASQGTEDFVHGINQALLYVGKLPWVILSDNLKAFVIKADRYEPEFNELSRQLAAYYELDLRAARVARPKDKASVENMVNTVYRRIYAPLRNEVFHSLDELNQAMSAQLAIHNHTPFQKRQGTRHEVFQSKESPQMRDLPSSLFELKKSTRAKVQHNYHVFLGEDKQYYSVPFRYVGKRTTIVYTRSQVEVYLGTKRIALHSRLQAKEAYQYQTQDTHMPQNHLHWKKSRSEDAAQFLEQAQTIGTATYWAIHYVLLSQIKASNTYDSCRAILRLAKTYSKERLEQAAQRCQSVNKANLSMLKSILEKGLDQVKDEPEPLPMPRHENIRGPKAYQ